MSAPLLILGALAGALLVGRYDATLAAQGYAVGVTIIALYLGYQLGD